MAISREPPPSDRPPAELKHSMKRGSAERNVPSFVIDIVTDGTGWNPAVRLKGRSAKLPGGLLSARE